MRVYLDCCCLNRPFDDQSQDRIRVEAVTVAGCFARAQEGRLQLVRSSAHVFEIERTPEPERRFRLLMLLACHSVTAAALPGLAEMSRQLQELGIDKMDAVHLAMAKTNGVDVFLTVDDRLLKKAQRADILRPMRITTPVLFIAELD